MQRRKGAHSKDPKTVERFAGDVAHEFNNLLTVVAGHCQLALKHTAPEDPLRNSIEEIARTAERGTELARKLLSYGRQLVTQPRRVDLDALIRKLCPWIEYRAGIQCQVQLAEGLWPVRCDADQIEQIIVTLAMQARQAVPNGGRLTLATANLELADAASGRRWAVPRGSYVMLSVGNSGKSMDHKGQREHREAGLRWDVLQSIVKQAGGAVRMERKRGKGATVKILFPKFEGKSQPEVRQNRAHREGGETILVVDDDPGIRDLILRALTVDGFNVLSAEDGQKALEISQKYNADIHLLLTDVVMPGINGRELAEWLVPFRPCLKVLYMSGGCMNDPVLRERVRRGGAAYLQKPFSLVTMAHTVREMIHGPSENRS